MKKNIDEEINKLLLIKKDIENIDFIRRGFNKHIAIVSQSKYDKLSNQIIMSDLMFYVFSEDIAEYVDEDVVLLENNKVFVIRDGECINTIELEQ